MQVFPKAILSEKKIRLVEDTILNKELDIVVMDVLCFLVPFEYLFLLYAIISSSNNAICEWIKYQQCWPLL